MLTCKLCGAWPLSCFHRHLLFSECHCPDSCTSVLVAPVVTINAANLSRNPVSQMLFRFCDDNARFCGNNQIRTKMKQENRSWGFFCPNEVVLFFFLEPYHTSCFRRPSRLNFNSIYSNIEPPSLWINCWSLNAVWALLRRVPTRRLDLAAVNPVCQLDDDRYLPRPR